MNLRPLCFAIGIVCSTISSGMAVRADGPSDNRAADVRPIPPPGIPISDEQRKTLADDLQKLVIRIGILRASKSELTKRFLPDVEIFARAVELALSDDSFYEPQDFDRAQLLLRTGNERAAALEAGAVPWNGLTGLQKPTVRGFRSKIDGSVQPYGVVYSDVHQPQIGIRADVWCRGRSEKGLELQFIATRMSSTDPQPAPGVLMIHPFGRYCNANKLAGEVDTLEALEHAMSEYPISPDRVSIRGFSMGGAAAWHLAVHYPGKWFAANPGAGFSETPQFLKVFQSESLQPSWYEQKLWQLYDCPLWATNLRMLPTIAYSGEIDKQKQAADVMAEATWNLPENERFELTHIIAPKTAHSVSPAARLEIEKRLDTLDKIGIDRYPHEIVFTTSTLKYNHAHWVIIHGLQEHWRPAKIKANFSESFPLENNVPTIQVLADNVTEFSLEFPADHVPGDLAYLRVSVLNPETRVAETQLQIPRRSDRSWGVRVKREDSQWRLVPPTEPPSKELVKRHDLQGPIDDAFMGPFIFVKPTSRGPHDSVNRWVEAELNRAIKEWRRQMRGEITVKTSEELQKSDVENFNLVLWGDPKSNPTIAEILDKLPIQWNAESIQIGTTSVSADKHVPVLIYPNPKNPDRYIVLNSGFTYREYDYLNNARQVPKLPDWAILDLSVPPDSRWPGKVVDANFFDEGWQVKTNR